jgi:hypothetical protein
MISPIKTVDSINKSDYVDSLSFYLEMLFQYLANRTSILADVYAISKCYRKLDA